MTPPKLLRTVAFSILTFLFAVAMGVGTSFAQVYVSADGNDAAAGTQANPVETLQEAVDRANAGETVFIAGGNYSTEIVDSDKSLTFETYERSGISVATLTDFTFQGGMQIAANLSDETLVFAGTLVIGDATFTVNNADFIAVENLTVNVGSTFEVESGTFEPDANLVVNGDLAMASGTTLFFDHTHAVSGAGDIGGGGSIIVDGSVTLGSAMTFVDDLLLEASGTLDLVNNTLTLEGDFENELGSTFDATDPASALVFNGGVDQVFFPRQLEVNDLSVTGSATNLIVRTTLRVNNDLNVAVNSTMELGQAGDAAVHIRLLGTGTFNNDGEYSSPSGVNGFIIDEGGNSLSGNGVFGNIEVQDITTTLASNLSVSGEILVRTDGTLALAGNTLTFTDDDVAVSTLTLEGTSDVDNGTIAVSGDALYDLVLERGNLEHLADASEEFAASGLRNVTMTRTGTTGAYTVTAGLNADFEVAGTLTVGDDVELADNGAEIELSGDSQTHSIVGSITGTGSLLVTGNNVAVNGSGNDQSAIVSLEVNTTGTFSSSNLMALTADLTNTAGSSSVTFNEEQTGTEIGGDISVVAGSLTLGHADEDEDLEATGIVNVNAGALTINSNLTTGGTADGTGVGFGTTLASGSINLGSNDYETASLDRNGTGSITASSGTFVLNGNLDNDNSASNDLTLVNLEIASASVITTSQNVAQDQVLTVTGEFTYSGAGSLTLTNVNLVFDGSTFTSNNAATVASTNADSWLTIKGGNLKLQDHFNVERLEIDGNTNFVQGGTTSVNEHTVTVSTLFLHTSGAVNLGAGSSATAVLDNTLTIGGAFNYVSGSYLADDGVININGAFDIASNVSFPNVAFAGNATTDEGTITITESAVFTGALTGLVDDQLIFGNGIDVTISIAPGTVTAEDIVLGSGISYTYNGGGGTAGTELASSVEDFELATGSNVTLPNAFGDLTVNGDLTLGAVLTMGTDGDLIVGEDTEVTEGVQDPVIFNGGEFQFPTDGIVSLTIAFASLDLGTESSFFSEVDFQSLVIAEDVTIIGPTGAGAAYTLSSDLTVDPGHTLTLNGPADTGAGASPTFTVAGDLTLGATITGGAVTAQGALDLTGAANGYQLAIGGGLSAQMVDGLGAPAASGEPNITLGATTPRISFTGSSDGTISVRNVNAAAEWAPADPVVINKSGDGLVTLSTGNLAPATSDDLTLSSGVLATSGSSVVILVQEGIEDDEQGYSRTNGVIAGNVRKAMPANVGDDAVGTNANFNRVVFPVGNTSGEYRPLIFNFDDESGTQAFNLTVSHVNSSPLGVQGLPAGDAVKYPDFHWTVESDLVTPLPTDYTYQVYAEAEGYDIDDLGFTMNDVTLIRRAAGSASTNQWNQTATSYDNELTPAPLPIVRGLDASQLIRTQKRLLAFGLPSTIRVENAVSDTSRVNVDQNLTIDFANVFAGTTGGVEYSVSSSNTAAVDTLSDDGDMAFDGSELTLRGIGVGESTITVTGTDATGDSASEDFLVIVSPEFELTALAADIDTAGYAQNIDEVLELNATTFVQGGYISEDDSTYTLELAESSVGSDTLLVEIFGAQNDSLRVTAGDSAFAGATATVTLRFADSNSDTVRFDFEHTINAGFMASNVSLDDVGLRLGDDSSQTPDTLTIESIAALFTGGSSPTYTVSSSDSDTASVTVDGDSFMVMPVATSTDSSTVTITVEATDLNNNVVTRTFEVTSLPAYGDVNADGTVNSTDASTILNAVIEEITFTAVQEGAADVNTDGNVNSFDASVAARYFIGDVTELPFSPSAKVQSVLANFGEATSSEGVMTVPVNVDGNVTAFDLSATFDASVAELASVNMKDLPEDWMVVKSTDEEGKVKFALAGITPLSKGQIAELTFTIKDENGVLNLSATGSANGAEFELDEVKTQEIPQEFALEQNYPNPFNPTTNVRYQLPASADVTVELYTISGQKVQTLVNTRQNAGVYTLNVDGSRLASGVYIYRIIAKADNQTFTTTKKMTLIK